MSFVRLAGLGFVALFLLGAAATQRVERDEGPEVKLRAKRVSENGARCVEQSKIELVRGPVPADAREVVRMTLTSADAPYPLGMFEEAFQRTAVDYCVDGVSFLKASADEKTGGVYDAEAAGWTRVPVEPPPPEPVAPADAGPADPFEF